MFASGCIAAGRCADGAADGAGPQPARQYLYVVGKGNTVDQRLVSLGPTSGDMVAILSGVAEGDQVITGNLQKIGPGMPISPLPQKPAT